MGALYSLWTAVKFRNIVCMQRAKKRSNRMKFFWCIFKIYWQQYLNANTYWPFANNYSTKFNTTWQHIFHNDNFIAILTNKYIYNTCNYLFEKYIVKQTNPKVPSYTRHVHRIPASQHPAPAFRPNIFYFILIFFLFSGRVKHPKHPRPHIHTESFFFE